MSFQLICCRRYRSLGGESKLSTSEGDEQSRENGDDCLNQINLGIQKLISKTALPSESPNSPFAAINSEIELPADSIAAKFFLFLLSVRNEPVVARHGLERLGEMRPMSHASFQLSPVLILPFEMNAIVDVWDQFCLRQLPLTQVVTVEKKNKISKMKNASNKKLKQVNAAQHDTRND